MAKLSSSFPTVTMPWMDWNHVTIAIDRSIAALNASVQTLKDTEGHSYIREPRASAIEALRAQIGIFERLKQKIADEVAKTSTPEAGQALLQPRGSAL